MIYFIQQEADGPIKIGVSTDPCKRLRQLQTSTQYKLRLVALLPDPVRERDWTEASIHKSFAHLHISGEWFRPEPELTNFIKAQIPILKRNVETAEQYIGDYAIARKRQEEELRRIDEVVAMHEYRLEQLLTCLKLVGVNCEGEVDSEEVEILELEH